MLILSFIMWHGKECQLWEDADESVLEHHEKDINESNTEDAGES